MKTNAISINILTFHGNRIFFTTVRTPREREDSKTDKHTFNFILY